MQKFSSSPSPRSVSADSTTKFPKRAGRYRLSHRHLTLRTSDKEQLEKLVSQGSTPIKVFKRAQALLELDCGQTLQKVATQVGVDYNRIALWRNRYSTEGLAILYDKPRSGRPPRIDGDQRAKLTALACSPAPEGRSQWSLRLFAAKAVELEIVDELSFKHAGRILKKTNSNPI